MKMKRSTENVHDDDMMTIMTKTLIGVNNMDDGLPVQPGCRVQCWRGPSEKGPVRASCDDHPPQSSLGSPLGTQRSQADRLPHIS
jgi:hypothetical protein